MTATLDPQEPTPPPAPGSLASTALDKALLAMQTGELDRENETPADYFARIVTARSLDAARVEGLSIHATVAAMGRQLVAVAALLPALPTAKEVDAELTILETM